MQGEHKRRRLLAVCAAAEPGGAEIGLVRLLDRIRARGWSPVVTTPGPGAIEELVRSRGWEWRRLDPGGLTPSPRATLRAIATAPRARRLAGTCDLVYLNGTTTARLLPFLGGVPTVLHVHDMVQRTPRFWSRARVVLADSGAVAARLGALPAEVVHCPVEREPPPASPPFPAEPRPIVGFVGRIEPRKGPLDLVLAAPAIRAAVPGARIVIVGADTYGADPDYRQSVRSATGVEHYDWAADAAGFLGCLDVLVAPSRSEPFGTVVAEAMASGTPVVAGRVDGLVEVVDDGVTGRLVQPGDIAALAHAVTEVLAHRDDMGTAARVSAQRFDADNYAQRVGDLLDSAAR